MFRALVAILILICAILWLPFWLQIVIFAVAIILVRLRLLLILPAILADLIYAPTHNLSFVNFRVSLLIIAMIVLWQVLISQTRLADLYVLEKK